MIIGLTFSEAFDIFNEKEISGDNIERTFAS